MDRGEQMRRRESDAAGSVMAVHPNDQVYVSFQAGVPVVHADEFVELEASPTDSFPKSIVQARRAVNVHRNRGLGDVGSLTGLELDEVLDWQQVSIGTISAIVQAPAEQSMSSVMPIVAVEATSASVDTETVDAPQRSSGLPTLVDDISKIIAWQIAIGVPADSPVGESLPDGTPDEVLSVREHLGHLSANDILDQDDLEMDAAGLLDNALRKLDAPAIQVLKQRFFADKSATLDELGPHLGVARERVPHIEGTSGAAMLHALSTGSLDVETRPSRRINDRSPARLGISDPDWSIKSDTPQRGSEAGYP